MYAAPGLLRTQNNNQKSNHAYFSQQEVNFNQNYSESSSDEEKQEVIIVLTSVIEKIGEESDVRGDAEKILSKTPLNYFADIEHTSVQTASDDSTKEKISESNAENESDSGNVSEEGSGEIQRDEMEGRDDSDIGINEGNTFEEDKDLLLTNLKEASGDIPKEHFDKVEYVPLQPIWDESPTKELKNNVPDSGKDIFTGNRENVESATEHGMENANEKGEEGKSFERIEGSGESFYVEDSVKTASIVLSSEGSGANNEEFKLNDSYFEDLTASEASGDEENKSHNSTQLVLIQNMKTLQESEKKPLTLSFYNPETNRQGQIRITTLSLLDNSTNGEVEEERSEIKNRLAQRRSTPWYNTTTLSGSVESLEEERPTPSPTLQFVLTFDEMEEARQPVRRQTSINRTEERTRNQADIEHQTVQGEEYHRSYFDSFKSGVSYIWNKMPCSKGWFGSPGTK